MKNVIPLTTTKMVRGVLKRGLVGLKITTPVTICETVPSFDEAVNVFLVDK